MIASRLSSFVAWMNRHSNRSHGVRSVMRNSKPLKLTSSSKEPYAPISDALQMPIALYEALNLTRKIKTDEGAKLTALINSFIEVILDDHDAIMKLENLVANEYRMAFLPPEKFSDFESGESAATLAQLIG